MGRTLTLSLLAGAALAIGCGSDWNDEERSAFRDNCLTNVRIEDEALRTAICDCTLERTTTVYTYAEVNSGDPQINTAFVDIIKQCSREHNVRARLPEPPG